MVKGSDSVGREIPKDYQQIVRELVNNQGWRYQIRKHPVIYAPNPADGLIVISSTPGDKRSLQNFIAEVRRRGGIWPPPRRS